MDTSDISGLWLLVYCVGLVLAFGIGEQGRNLDQIVLISKNPLRCNAMAIVMLSDAIELRGELEVTARRHQE